MFIFRIFTISVRFPQWQIRKLHYLSSTIITKSDRLQCPRTISAVGYNLTKNYVNKVDHHITYEEVVESINKPKTIIVDVRNPDEVKAAGQIPSSINIPLNNIQEVLGSMSEDEFKRNYQRSKPSQSDNIIFYCKSGKRATKATDIALNLGYLNAMGLSLGPNAHSYASKEDAERISISDARAQGSTREGRMARRQQQLNILEANYEAEGSCYGAGIDDTMSKKFLGSWDEWSSRQVKKQ